MNALFQKIRLQLEAALETYWQQLTVGQSSYPGIAPGELKSPAEATEGAGPLVEADLFATAPLQAEELRP